MGTISSRTVKSSRGYTSRSGGSCAAAGEVRNDRTRNRAGAGGRMLGIAPSCRAESTAGTPETARSRALSGLAEPVGREEEGPRGVVAHEPLVALRRARDLAPLVHPRAHARVLRVREGVPGEGPGLGERVPVPGALAAEALVHQVEGVHGLELPPPLHRPVDRGAV